VLNDRDSPEPWDLLADINDERLVRFDLDKNRGRYFADAVSLSATPDQYFMTQDADDWSSLERAALLYECLREEHADAAFSALNEHRQGRPRPRKISFTACLDEPPPRLRLLAHHPGLYCSSTLRAIGGYYGGYRIGYDRLLVGLVALAGRVAYVDEPLYAYEVHADSLSRSAATGMSSQVRWRVRTQLDKIYDQAYVAYCGYVAGHHGLDQLRNLIRTVATARVSAEDHAALARQANALRARLANRPKHTKIPMPVADWASHVGAPRKVARSMYPGRSARPDVSIVIPTRYDTASLPATITSFLEQRSDRTRLEFVIVDDASPLGVDGRALMRSLDLVARDASITVAAPGRHIGIPQARNLGARCARADRLFITDAHVAVERDWDAVVAEYTRPRRVLAATIVHDETGACGFGAGLQMPGMTMVWNDTSTGDLGPVQVAASSGMVLDRNLYWSLGGFDEGMVMYGSAEPEFSVRAWLRGAEILNVSRLRVHHRFRSALERHRTVTENLPFVLQNRLRFALLYLDEDGVLRILRDMARSHPAPSVSQACDLVEASDVWSRRIALRERELLSFSWFARRFGFDIPGGCRADASSIGG
jgi:glycosyltransferase involved in cell wall biosynthesis